MDTILVRLRGASGQVSGKSGEFHQALVGVYLLQRVAGLRASLERVQTSPRS
jgi:hypothetical protein